ncbi:superoxide dismutase family protein [Candidatus Poribacteria bacterium]|nr:superoxide dismutase family protein [Candidatus Poribacteria bacterium]
MRFNLYHLNVLPLLFTGIIFLLSGCEVIEKSVISSSTSKQAIATINSASDSNLNGIATFTQVGQTVMFRVEIQNGSPGQHAVHIHENGDCSSPDGKSAGGHWNPTNVAHGKWGEGEFHLGDIGNIDVGEDGTGSIELSTELWEIGTGSIRDIVGKGMIVHAGTDDYTSQPSGNAGIRIGCGVIELVE